MSVRLQAIKVLVTVLNHQGSLSTSLPMAVKNTAEKDRPLLQQLCYGTLRFLPRLQVIAEQLLHKPLKRKDMDVQATILLGLYQLLETRIPAHAAIQETVEVTSQLKKPWAKGLVNGVLRNLQRQPELLQSLEPRSDFRFCHPKWLVTRLKKDWPEHYTAILEQNNQQPPMTLRVNAQHHTRNDYLAQLHQVSIDGLSTSYSESGITLKKAADVEDLPGFRDGWTSIQDEAAQLAASILNPGSGDYVLDACAAPGGKTCHLLEQHANLECLALDISDDRLAKVSENLHRLKLDCQLQQADAATADWWDGRLFDHILLDAPCSATGVIRRNPDIKHLRQPEDIDALSSLQLQILKNLWAMLKPGGRLLYATCSVLKQENELLVGDFLQQQTEATELAIEADWGIQCSVGRQLFPQAGGHDGFYYALLEKRL